MGTGMPKLIFDDWKTPEADGWPPNHEWCVVFWGEDDESPNVFVGAYFEEKKHFYANFGLGGAVLDRDEIFAWTLLYGHRWESGLTEDEKIEKIVANCVADLAFEGMEATEEDKERMRRVARGETTALEEMAEIVAKYRSLTTPVSPPNDPILTPNLNGEGCAGRDLCCEECQHALICWPSK